MKLTVAIPTIAGREKYLMSALKTCISQDYENFEIIVSDNSPGDALAVVETFNDKRIKYIKPKQYLPMSAHWDYMVPHISGEIATIIGDDDGLMPGAIRRVSEIAKNHGLQPIQHSLANYCWPDFPNRESRNRFRFIHSPGLDLTIKKSSDYLYDLCQAKVRYSDGPMIYHNFIPVKLLRKLMLNNSMFHRSSPDIYSSITIAALSDVYITTQEILTLSGQGARANGASVLQGGTDGKRFIAEMQFSEYFSRFSSTSVHLQTLDSILEAIERYELLELGENINYEKYFCCAANDCLDISNRLRATKQLALVIRDATKCGCLPYVIKNRGSKLLEKIGSKFNLQRKSTRSIVENSKFNVDVEYLIPESVTDIYGATCYLDNLLKCS